MPLVAPAFTRKRASAFRSGLLRWFATNQRSLPWRRTRDPYRILLSEIMLQQTRVAVVEDRYRQFLRRFPTVKALARARLQSVLAAWSGLGYYRRARALHAAARQIVRNRAFPRTALALMELPGVGRYTANAVASIAFAEPVPVVDGNVKRVLSRFCGQALTDDQCWAAADALLDRLHPGDFNQALMELGAVICVPGTPRCEQCPVRSLCASRSAGPAGAHAPRRKSVLNYALILRDSLILLEQRSRTATLMPEMWELPALQAGSAMHEPRLPLLRLRHSITNTDYSVFIYAGDGQDLGKQGDVRRSRRRWVRLSAAHRLPLTGLTKKILVRLKSSSP
jgi:A/G-specific adenine glycosylase